MFQTRVWNQFPFSGSEIVDYEIEYERYELVPDALGIKKEQTTRVGPLNTSRWLERIPVKHAGAVLTGLRASTEYGKIRVRALNRKFPGAWTGLGYRVKTRREYMQSSQSQRNWHSRPLSQHLKPPRDLFAFGRFHQLRGPSALHGNHH